MKKLWIVVVAVALIAGCAGVERKSVSVTAENRDCIEVALEKNRDLRGFTSSLDSIAEDLSEFLFDKGDTLSDEVYSSFDDCQQKISIQASVYQTEAMRATLETMDADARYLEAITDSFLTRWIKHCLKK